MNNFDFYNPTRILFGENRVASIDEYIPGDARVLVLYGGESARRTGTLDEVKQALGKRTVFEFGGIEPNPQFDTLMKAVELARSEQVDFLLAVGGGSVIDGTKFVAAAIPFEGDPWTILTEHGVNVRAAMPFGTVLTLPATGSEMNINSVVTNPKLHAKLAFKSPYVFPQFSVLDPTKTYTLPQRQLANGVVDAFVHIAEQYLTYPTGAMVQDRFAEGLLRTLIDLAPKIVEGKNDYDARANFMWTTTWALNGLIGAGVPQDWATHMIGHELTALYDIDHARTLAIVLPSLLRERRDVKGEKLLQFAERVWDITEGDDDARIEEAIVKTEAFFESLDISTHLSDYELGEEAIEAVVKQLEAHGMIALGEQQEITPDVSRRILQRSLKA
ncbi:iron-containing alcohol dehydrogenase [Pontiellaceae bacterium B12219]|nr:iron-containing alcohol dehydrogenase [Pontiellaceae bacterium B12219]